MHLTYAMGEGYEIRCVDGNKNAEGHHFGGLHLFFIHI